jgi:hypothetical protein
MFAKKLALFVLLVCIVCSTYSAVWREVSPCCEHWIGEILIAYKKSPFTYQDIDDLVNNFTQFGLLPIDAKPVYNPDCRFQVYFQTFQFDESSVPDFKSFSDQLMLEGIVRWVIRNPVLKLFTNDTFYRDQWYLRNRGDGSRGNPIFRRTDLPATAGADISMEPAWRLYMMVQKNRSRPVAAIIDSGFYIEHE